MKFETSKTLYEYGYSNGGVSLYDLMFEKPYNKCKSDKNYAELMEILLHGTWNENSSINGFSLEKLLEDYVEDLLLREDYYVDRSELTDQHILLYKNQYSYLSNLLRMLSATRKLLINKSLNPANVETTESYEELLVETPLFYSANRIGLEDALEDLSVLNTSYNRLVIRNLIDYSDTNNFKVWRTDSIDVPHPDTFFVSIKSQDSFRVLTVLPLLDIEEIEICKVRMSNYLTRKNRLNKYYTGIIIIPFGSSESLENLFVVPLSCLRD